MSDAITGITVGAALIVVAEVVAMVYAVIDVHRRSR